MEDNIYVEQVKAMTAIVPNFPEENVNFIDITTVLCDPATNHLAYTMVRNLFPSGSYDMIISPESRGWLFGQAMALELGKPHVLIRKPGKLPRPVARQEYACEYGTGVLEVHQGDIMPEARVLLVDDVLATCGTALAITELIRGMGAKVIGVAALYCLDYLPKASMPEGCELRAAVHYATPPRPYNPK